MSKPKSIRTLPSVEYLRECFDYDPLTGELRWKVRPRKHYVSDKGWICGNGQFAGKVAGCLDHNGHRVVRLDRLYRAGRVVWKLMTGDDPSKTVDHIDGDRANDRWNNLRIATAGEQQWNRGPNKRNTSGRRGVVPHQGKWTARICYNWRHLYLGVFDTIDEASAAYEAAALELRGKFYREVKK